MSVSGDVTPGLGHVVQDLAPSSEEVGPHASLVEKLYQRLAREPGGRGPVRIGLELREPRLGFGRLYRCNIPEMSAVAAGVGATRGVS